MIKLLIGIFIGMYLQYTFEFEYFNETFDKLNELMRSKSVSENEI